MHLFNDRKYSHDLGCKMTIIPLLWYKLLSSYISKNGQNEINLMTFVAINLSEENPNYPAVSLHKSIKQSY